MWMSPDDGLALLGNKPLPEPSFMTPHGVSRPQWIVDFTFLFYGGEIFDLEDTGQGH